MDPQKLSQLDPKLREAYQRVMGTPIPQPQVPPAQAQIPQPDPTPAPQPQPEPTTPPQTPPQQQEPFFIPQPETPPAGGPQPQATTQQASSNFTQMNSEVAAAPIEPQTQNANFSNFATPPAMPQAQTMAIKKKSGIMPVLYVIVGVVFLVVYTLFWTKIFNFQLPFLP